MVNKLPPNVPTICEVEFVAGYLDRRLRAYEVTQQWPSASTARAEIDNIQQALTDLTSDDGGNYQTLIDELDRTIAVTERLSRVRELLASMKSVSTAAMPERQLDFRLPRHRAQFSRRSVELEEYLLSLERIPSACEADIASEGQDLARTCDLLLEYFEFLLPRSSRHSEKMPPTSLVFLLRDTLLVYLGARRLQRGGYPIEARAVLISRALLQSFAAGQSRNPLYAQLYNQLFSCLADGSQHFSPEFSARYRGEWRKAELPGARDLDRFLEIYLDRVLAGAHNLLIVDNGVHGTMPLLAMAIEPRLVGMKLYTATPWLQDFYSGELFCRDSATMRQMEALVCQEELFTFERVEGDRLIVGESNDPAIQDRALHEIGYFLGRIERRFFA